MSCITNLPLLSTDYGLFFVLIMSTNQRFDGFSRIGRKLISKFYGQLNQPRSILFHSLDTSNFARPRSSQQQTFSSFFIGNGDSNYYNSKEQDTWKLIRLQVKL